MLSPQAVRKPGMQAEQSVRKGPGTRKNLSLRDWRWGWKSVECTRRWVIPLGLGLGFTLCVLEAVNFTRSVCVCVGVRWGTDKSPDYFMKSLLLLYGFLKRQEFPPLPWAVVVLASGGWEKLFKKSWKNFSNHVIFEFLKKKICPRQLFEELCCKRVSFFFFFFFLSLYWISFCLCFMFWFSAARHVGL